MVAGMRRIARKARLRVSQDQSGLALVEVLVTIAIFSFVLVAVLGLLDRGAESAPKDQERSVAIREVQSGLARMVRELRQAYRVVGTSPSSMRILMRIRKSDGTPVNRLVEYDCGLTVARQCIRREALPGELLPTTGEVVIDRLLNGTSTERPVFSFDQNADSVTPTYVAVRVEVPGSGERGRGFSHSVVLEDGFYARNMNLGS